MENDIADGILLLAMMMRQGNSALNCEVSGGVFSDRFGFGEDGSGDTRLWAARYSQPLHHIPHSAFVSFQLPFDRSIRCVHAPA
jgi:hypothetical protein